MLSTCLVSCSFFNTNKNDNNIKDEKIVKKIDNKKQNANKKDVVKITKRDLKEIEKNENVIKSDIKTKELNNQNNVQKTNLSKPKEEKKVANPPKKIKNGYNSKFEIAIESEVMLNEYEKIIFDVPYTFKAYAPYHSDFRIKYEWWIYTHSLTQSKMIHTNSKTLELKASRWNDEDVKAWAYGTNMIEVIARNSDNRELARAAQIIEYESPFKDDGKIDDKEQVVVYWLIKEKKFAPGKRIYLKHYLVNFKEEDKRNYDYYVQIYNNKHQVIYNWKWHINKWYIVSSDDDKVNAITWFAFYKESNYFIDLIVKLKDREITAKQISVRIAY